MSTALLVVSLALLAGDEESAPRKAYAVAPSLPALTKEEEDKLDDIVDRFILADTGRLRGIDAREAVKEFDKLGKEAIPALIRGLNKSAGLNHSCPVLTISQKLNRLLMASDDEKLLEFARDEIGAGVGRVRYAGVLQDLRFKVLMRKNALARRPKAVRDLTTLELTRALNTTRGPALAAVLVELEKRSGKEVLAGLSMAAASPDRDTQKLGRDLLDKHLTRQGSEFVKARLGEENVELRRSAVRSAGEKFPELAGYLIELLTDGKAEVRQEARQALVKISGEDFGPEPDASREQQRSAQARWQAWLEKSRR